MERAERRYVLSDASKFGRTSRVSFAPFASAQILTAGDVPQEYRGRANVGAVGE